MSMFNRRNAVIGYLALQALKHARRNAGFGYLAAQGVEHTRAHRRGRQLLRLVSYVALGIVSAGVIAALLFYWRRRSSGAAAVGEDVAEGMDVAGNAEEALVETDAQPIARTESVAGDVAEAVEPASA